MNKIAKKPLSAEDGSALEVWKYYGNIGSADKETMIKVVTWLLGFSAAILGSYATGKLTQFLPTILLIILGILVSVLAALTSLMYGGYATWNWSIADRIAQEHDWNKQLPGFDPIPRSEVSWTAAFPLWLAKPREAGIAPVFWVFFFVSVVSFAIHVVLLYSILRYGVI